jgi:hypothetical protein
MADNSGTGGLYFILGGLVVVVALGFFGYRGGYFGHHEGPGHVEETTVQHGPDHTTTTTTERPRP